MQQNACWTSCLIHAPLYLAILPLPVRTPPPMLIAVYVFAVAFRKQSQYMHHAGEVTHRVDRPLKLLARLYNTRLYLFKAGYAQANVVL